ncbi:MAG: UDP-N-acetylmuramoyl-L-alanine--D-glutamate ligase [Lentimonas sp.]
MMPQKIAILGAGISGQSARQLAEAQGHEVCVFDQKSQGDRDVFTEPIVNEFDAVVVSPGFAVAHPWRQIAEQSPIPCFGELGYAARFWKGRIIAITGTNGKSTITEFLAQALLAAGRQAVATGNIGYPLSAAVLSEVNNPDAFAILEVSSFQAEIPLGLELDGLIWTNFAEDHLDRYESMADYFAAKAKLLDCIKPSGLCVLSPQVRDWMNVMEVSFHPDSLADEEPLLVDVLASNSPFRQYPQSENFALIAELWQLLQLPEQALLEAASTFELAAHRLKCEATREGVAFWNDSKATNFHAVLAALSALESPIYWIGGGQMKGGDVEAFAREVATRVEAAFVYGEAGRRLANVLEKYLKIVVINDKLVDAILAATQAVDGIQQANILLSPGFSSFDQFSGFEARGKFFISTVLSLNGAQAAY